MNWTTGGTGPFTYGFGWKTSSGVSQPTPSFSQGSINLNDVAPGTTYKFEINEWNSWGEGSYNGSFTTASAPTSSFLGWVNQLVSNPDELNQIGPPMAGLTIDTVWAHCVNPEGAPIQVPFPQNPNTGAGEPAATTDSNGFFSIEFPLTYTYLGTTYYDVYTNGTCRDNEYQGSYGGAWVGSAPNPDLSINVSAPNGFWNATQYVTMSGTGQVLNFGLPQNQQIYTIPGIAFVHTAYASCGVSITTQITQSIGSYGAGSGYTDRTSWTNGTGANNVSNGESVVDFHEYSTGVINETSGAKFGEAYAIGPMFDPSENAVSVTDPESSPPPGETYPIPGYSGYYVDTVGPAGGYLNWSNGGTYTSTRGLNVSISLSGGWGGVSVGPAVDLSYTTTVGASQQKEIRCMLTDSGEPAGDDAQFYYTVDGGLAANDEAINVHVWFDDYCVPNNTTCN
ncbi:MAG TPA: hypothetical protein VMG36_05900 [Thermoplasmata archaeon]|nr:hypothetical protein [Thermoplasmata archaeon]